MSAIMPVMSIYKLPHGQYGYSGHVINFPQDVKSFATTLPRLPSEIDILVVQMSKSYRIIGATVKFYNGEKYLSTTENSEITEIDDLKEVNENTIDVRKNEYFTAEIVGVISYKGFSSCISCASKVLDCCNGIGECSKCGLKVRMDKCKKSAAAKVIIEGTTKST